MCADVKSLKSTYTQQEWQLLQGPQALLQKLVACNTVSSAEIAQDHGTGELVEMLMEHFQRCHLFCFKFEESHGKFNLLTMSAPALVALYRKQSLGLLFSGHGDTVPFNAASWSSDPLVLTAKDGKLYGRGSADMKGFIACAAAIASAHVAVGSQASVQESVQDAGKSQAQSHAAGEAQALIEEFIGDKQPISFLVTSDEETTTNGARTLAKLNVAALHEIGCAPVSVHYDAVQAQVLAKANSQFAEVLSKLPAAGQTVTPGSWLDHAFKDQHFSLIVLGEPTELKVVTAHKGWMARIIKVQGKAAHSSNPKLGCNALHYLLPLAQQLVDLAQEFETQHRDERFTVPQVTLNLGHIQGGQAPNLVCEQVQLDFDIRPIPSFNNRQVEECLQNLVKKYNEQHSSSQNITCTLSTYDDVACFENTDQHSLDLINKAILQLKDARLDPEFQCVNYCTEASLFQDLGPCVVMGPGNIAQAHKEDEFIAIEQLELCVKFLLSLIETNAQA